MLDHVRHVLIGLCLLAAALAAVRARARRAQARGTPERWAEEVSDGAVAAWLMAAATGFGLAWILGGSPRWSLPLELWGQGWAVLTDWLQRAPSAAMLAGCVGYFWIVLITNTGLIGIPRYRLLQSRVEAITSATQILGRDDARSTLLRRTLAKAENEAVWRIGQAVLSAPLTRIFRATRVVNAAEIQFLCLVSGEQLRLHARQIAIRLALVEQGADVLHRLQIRLASPNTNDELIRADCVTALATIYAAIDVPAEREAERIRVALWLTMVGLAAALAVNAVLGRDQILLAGALGGLLGSLAGLIRRQTLSLELIILSPVAGALNAMGGVLLVGFLASGNVKLLGETLGAVWNDPGSVEALALALLLGFSGGLFARLALTGSSYLLAPLGRSDASGPASAAKTASTGAGSPGTSEPSRNGSSPAVVRG